MADKIKIVEIHHLMELFQAAQTLPRHSRNDSPKPASVPNPEGKDGNGDTPIPMSSFSQASIEDSSVSAAEPQLMSDQEEHEGYYWGV